MTGWSGDGGIKSLTDTKRQPRKKTEKTDTEGQSFHQKNTSGAAPIHFPCSLIMVNNRLYIWLWVSPGLKSQIHSCFNTAACCCLCGAQLVHPWRLTDLRQTGNRTTCITDSLESLHGAIKCIKISVNLIQEALAQWKSSPQVKHPHLKEVAWIIYNVKQETFVQMTLKWITSSLMSEVFWSQPISKMGHRLFHRHWSHAYFCCSWRHFPQQSHF